MQRQVQERTERLGMTNESMDRLEDNSSGFMNDVNKYVKDQKRKAVFGGKFRHAFGLVKGFYTNLAFIAIGSKFGF